MKQAEITDSISTSHSGNAPADFINYQALIVLP
jgi:hypothetical protein